MSTTTSRVGLYKSASDGSENVNVVNDLLNNMDKIDSWLGATICTSSTRPSSPWDGQIIKETNTLKMYVWHAGSSSWLQVMFGSANWDQSITLPGVTQQVKIGGTSSDASFATARTNATDNAFSSRVPADTVSRYVVTVDGAIQWGPGGSTALDTKLYRASANVLKTDDELQVVGNLVVSGAANLDDVNVAGDLNLGSSRYRTQLSSTQTLSNSATETVIVTFTIPANDAVVGAVYRIFAWGTGSVTATPTMTWRSRLGGVAGASMGGHAATARSGMTDGKWRVTALVSVAGTGATGTWNPWFEVFSNFVSNTSPYTFGMDLTSSPTNATTSAQDFVITAQWSAASASNVLTLKGYTAERVA